jgi:hypothetical protein
LADELLTEDPIAVAQQIAWRTLPRKSVSLSTFPLSHFRVLGQRRKPPKSLLLD